MWFTYALLSGFCATAVAVIAKWGRTHHDMYVLTMVRACVMALTIALVTCIMKRDIVPILATMSPRDWYILALTGIIGGCGWLFYFIALEYGSASYVVAIDKLSILFVLIFSYFLLEEPITFTNVLGGLLMVIGAWLIIQKQS